MIATQPLTDNEVWTAFEPGELIMFQCGDVAARMRIPVPERVLEKLRNPALDASASARATRARCSPPPPKSIPTTRSTSERPARRRPPPFTFSPLHGKSMARRARSRRLHAPAIQLMLFTVGTDRPPQRRLRFIRITIRHFEATPRNTSFRFNFFNKNQFRYKIRYGTGLQIIRQPHFNAPIRRKPCATSPCRQTPLSSLKPPKPCTTRPSVRFITQYKNSGCNRQDCRIC